MDRDNLTSEIKRLIITELDLRGRTEGDIQDDAPLFGSGLGLDSIDALQLAVALEERFGVTMPSGDQAKMVFSCVSSIVEHLAGATKK